MHYKILLIEDNAEMAENISCILQLAKYDVTHAADGKIGVDLAQRLQPDLILCDIMMPELDGYGVLHILNKDVETASIPFIFLTAKADKSDFRAGMNLGADDYITKPFDGVDLLKVIEMRLKKSELMKTAFGNNSSEVSAFFSKTRELRDFQKLSENRPVRSFKRKDLIFMEGQTPNDLYFIEKGQVKTYKVNYDGKELITGILKEGDFFGFVPLLEDKIYSESAEVIEDARVTIIPKMDFITLIYSSKDVARKFIKMLSNNLEEIEERLLDIAYQSVRQRVANALLKMGERFACDRKDGLITIARKDISNIVGTATESLNRTLADFKDEGLIEISGDGLKVINKAKLEKLVHI
ncbi:response regulator [Parachryseolinea silvisoli]|jgi:CRP-like cAMP-binding protein/ActR/RegA family two-component response regulator|uniref:response regulator n=1 Tax=Parachryseolinea silvisoli TaxID=2873601 RepID=UPI002265E2BD|nr:response regulator [Parachryseolinea silvisoli]MCD9015123.1 response regulator [Parachryseolinea silvisoli]